MTTEELDKEAKAYADEQIGGKPWNNYASGLWDGIYIGYKSAWRKAEYRESIRRQTGDRKAEPVPYRAKQVMYQPDREAFGHPGGDLKVDYNQHETPFTD